MPHERARHGSLTCRLLRDIVRQSCGFDPGAVHPETRLDEVERGGLGRYTLICGIEERFDIDFPADLVSALETVDDLLYFTATKIDQREAHR